MKKIGLIDYYLSEWHANNYPAWIEECNKKTGDCFEVAYAWAEKDVSPVDGLTSAEWAKKYGVTLCSSVEELCEKSDYILILAPSDPETHLRLCKAAFPCGKRTYVDKTFAPDFKTAKEIYALAEKYGVKFFSSSALRYADELKSLEGKTTSVSTAGGGSNLPEYIVHQAEMVVKTLGIGAKAIRAEAEESGYRLSVAYDDDRKAVMNYSPSFGFSVSAETTEGKKDLAIESDFFKNLVADILRFYNEGTLSFEAEQTLEVMKLRESAIKAFKETGVWIRL